MFHTNQKTSQILSVCVCLLPVIHLSLTYTHGRVRKGNPNPLIAPRSQMFRTLLRQKGDTFASLVASNAKTSLLLLYHHYL